MIHIRRLEQNEVFHASALADSIYGKGLWEPSEAFEQKLLLWPSGSLAAFDNERLVGYAFGHPWSGDSVPLGEILPTLPEKPNLYYIHDVAVDKAFRGRLLGQRLAHALIQDGMEHGFSKFALVAVNGTAGFWESFGFKPSGGIAYGDQSAIKMVRTS